MSSDIRTMFRHCPSCGRRFEIRLVDKKLVGMEESTRLDHPVFIAKGIRTPGNFVILEDSVPTIVQAHEFEFSYMCKHCGHRWSEERPG